MRKFGLAAAVAALTVVALAGAATTTLPGGTSLSVTITTPTTGSTVAQGPVAVAGTASIGAAAPIANTLLLTVIDISGSTTQNVPGAACGNQNSHDAQANTILDCELAAAKALNDAAVAAGTVFRTGIIGFGGAIGNGTLADAQVADLSRAAGDVALIAPGSATGAPGVEDVDEVLGSAGLGGAPFASTFPSSGNGFSQFSLKSFTGNTNYWAAVRAARTVAATAGAPMTSKIVVMLSDGASTRGGPANENVLQAFAGGPADPNPPRFFTFAIGANADCVTTSSFGDLQDIANASGGTCQEIDDPADAAATIPGAIASSLYGMNMRVDGAPFAASFSVSPALPQTGPATVSYSTATGPLAPGTHQICVQARGSDGGGNGEASECVDVTVKAPPTADAGPDRTTPEGTPVAMAGSIAGGTGTWSSAGGTGACSPDDANDPTADVTCTDDGVYTLTFTGTDGINSAVTDSAAVTVTNVAPIPHLTIAGGPHPLAQPVSASTVINDPGTGDTHTCTIVWGDGATSSSCAASHVYAAGGTYIVVVGATDDDGGNGIDTKAITIDAPPAVSAGSDRSGGEGALVAVSGSVTDEDFPPSSWTAAPGAGVDAGASCSFTDASSAATTVACTDDGEWTLTLTATDGINPPVSDSLTLTLANADPTIAITSPAGGTSPRAVSFAANVADPGTNDGLTCSIAWGDGDTSAGTVSGGVCTASHTYAAGVVAATLTATVADDDGGSASASRSLTFNRPPSCTGVGTSLATLWPPNHAMRLIVLGGATDPDGDPLTYAITSVRQDEPLNSGGDGNTSPDALLSANGALWLRAERSGTGDGRVYTIGFSVSDGNASCTGSVRVSVPHSAKKAAVLSPGPGYDSLG